MEPEEETAVEDVAPSSSSQANLSDLVKEIVKEMDGDDFYESAYVYDESTEVWSWMGLGCSRDDVSLHFCNTSLMRTFYQPLRLS